MLTLTRELILEDLLSLPELADRYAQADAEYVARAVAWLSAGEVTLRRLRSPLTGFLAAEIAKILATQEGYRDPGIGGKPIPARKAARIAASLSLSRVEVELRAVVIGIENRLLPLRDKLAQLLAVASASQPIALPVDVHRDEWLRDVWATLKQSPEGRSMTAYLGSALPPVDLLHLLGETLDNLLSRA